MRKTESGGGTEKKKHMGHYAAVAAGVQLNQDIHMFSAYLAVQLAHLTAVSVALMVNLREPSIEGNFLCFQYV